MKTFVLALMISFTATSVKAADLVLEGERWLAQFTTFVCEDGNTEALEAPAQFEGLDVKFGRLTTDYSLDNVLVKATFSSNGSICNYSAMLFADNTNNTVSLTDSTAYSVNEADCAQGKATLDEALSLRTYKYLHGRAAILLPATNASAACGQDAEVIAIHFQARGRLN